jgi:hypothetical protein
LLALSGVVTPPVCHVDHGVLPELDYRLAVHTFGQHGAAELIYLVGLYCLVSVTLNGFDVSLISRGWRGGNGSAGAFWSTSNEGFYSWSSLCQSEGTRPAGPGTG